MSKKGKRKEIQLLIILKQPHWIKKNTSDMHTVINGHWMHWREHTFTLYSWIVESICIQTLKLWQNLHKKLGYF